MAGLANLPPVLWTIMAPVKARSPKVNKGHPKTKAIPGGVQLGILRLLYSQFSWFNLRPSLFLLGRMLKKDDFKLKAYKNTKFTTKGNGFISGGEK